MSRLVVIRTACGDGVHLFPFGPTCPCVCGANLEIGDALDGGSVLIHPSTFAPEPEEEE